MATRDLYVLEICPSTKPPSAPRVPGAPCYPHILTPLFSPSRQMNDKPHYQCQIVTNNGLALTPYSTRTLRSVSHRALTVVNKASLPADARSAASRSAASPSAASPSAVASVFWVNVRTREEQLVATIQPSSQSNVRAANCGPQSSLSRRSLPLPLRLPSCVTSGRPLCNTSKP